MTSAEATITHVTLVDEARFALNWEPETNIDEPVFSDDEIKRFLFQNFLTTPSTYSLQAYQAGKVYSIRGYEDFGMWLWGPTFTGEVTTGTATGAQSTTVLIDSAATFDTDGITVGQTVSLDVGGESALVESIDSETQLTTAALSDSGTYDATEAYSIPNEYTMNSRGSIEVTEGTHSTKAIPVSASRVDFANAMSQMLHWLATHRCQEVAQNSLSGSTDPTRVKDELLTMAEYWQGITSTND